MFSSGQFSQIKASDTKAMAEIAGFLSRSGLDLDPGISRFIIARHKGEIAACGGLAGNIIKCVAINEDLRGGGLALQLATELINLGFEKDRTHLFVFTKPVYIRLFEDCGFQLLAQVPNIMALMDNNIALLRHYQLSLAKTRHEGAKIGCIVMNANPFTKGHLYLAAQAAAQCDWLHIFLVREDASVFPFADRLAMAKAGLAGISNLTLHEGSEYVISRATFPCYFLKEIQTARRCYIELDVKIFRHYIAPPLGITDRFVGTEPYCEMTAQYNRSLRYWLKTKSQLPAPAIAVTELPRLAGDDGAAVSASALRAALAANDWAQVAALAPASTLNYLRQMAADGRLAAAFSRPMPALSPIAKDLP